VVGYSSIAQLGFITLGIFALDPKGAQGAVFQMINHGLVTAGLFFIIAVLAARAGGSESLSRMGGIAYRAPVLAGLFLVVALATLAMPGSANFVGELLILFGVLEDKLVYGVVASAGIALAAVYMIRFYQRTMHNRVRPGVDSRDVRGIELVAIASVVVVILGLGVYPQFVVERSERATVAKVRQAEQIADRGGEAEAAPAPQAVPGGGAVPVGPDGQPIPVGPDGEPIPQGAGGQPIPVGPDGQPIPIGPDGQPVPVSPPAGQAP
jgi:NADH-quinone oxidoreductase subunit M